MSDSCAETMVPACSHMCMRRRQQIAVHVGSSVGFGVQGSGSKGKQQLETS